jgi:hypothetical protein
MLSRAPLSRENRELRMSDNDPYVISYLGSLQLQEASDRTPIHYKPMLQIKCINAFEF